MYPEWQRSSTTIIFMDNWGYKIVPKHLLFVICWQFNQLSCLPSSIFNGSLSKYATHWFVWEGCLHIVMPLHILYFLMLFISLPPALFFYDTSEMVPIATPLRRRWKWRCCRHPQRTLLTMPVINAAAPAYSDLPRSSLVLFPCSSSHRAHSPRSRDLLLMICHLFRTPQDGSSV